MSSTKDPEELISEDTEGGHLASGIEKYFGGYIVICDFCCNYEIDEENEYDEFRSQIRKKGWRVYGNGYKCPVCVEDELKNKR